MKNRGLLVAALALAVALVATGALLLRGHDDTVSVMPASKQQRDSAAVAQDASASTSTSPVTSRELAGATSVRLLVTDAQDSPIEGAQVRDVLPRVGGEVALLAATSADGSADFEAPASGSVAVFCSGFSPASARVAGGSEYRVRLAASVPLRVRCADMVGRPVQGVRVRAQILNVDRWTEHEPWDRRVAYEGVTGNDGSVAFQVAPGQYFVEPSFTLGQCLARSNLLPAMCATAPGVDALLTVEDVVAAVVSAPGAVLAWAILEQSGVVPVGSWADDGCAVVRASLRQQYPHSLVFAMMPSEGIHEPRLRLRAYCTGYGWCDTEVVLAELRSLRPQELCGPAGEAAGQAEVTIECYQPSGPRVDWENFDFLLCDGPGPRPVVFGSLQTNRPQAIPPGTWWLRGSSKSIKSLTKSIRVEVLEGDKKLVRCDLAREIRRIQMRLVAHGAAIVSGNCLVSVKDTSGWVASNVAVDCAASAMVVPLGDITLRIARLGYAQADIQVPNEMADRDTLTVELTPVSDLR